MELKILEGILFFVVMVGAASALSSNMHEVYEPRETIIFEILGSVTQAIDTEQIKIKRGNVEIATDLGIKKLDGRYFIWMVAPAESGEVYLVKIEGVHTYFEGQERIIDFVQNFSVEGNLTDYYINPGVIFSSGNFEINVVSNEDIAQRFSVDFPETREIEIKPGINKLKFSTGSVENGLRFLTIGKYSVPAYLIGDGTSDENEIVIIEVPVNEEVEPLEVGAVVEPENAEGVAKFSFGSNLIRSVFAEGGALPILNFEVINDGEKYLETIQWSFNEEYFELVGNSSKIEIGETRDFELRVKNFDVAEIREPIAAYSEGYNSYFLVIVEKTIVPGNSSVEYYSEEEGQEFYYCSELGGSICNEEQSCSGAEISGLDGACCIGSCESDASGGGASWFGYFLGVILIGILVFVFFKYRSSKVTERSAIKKRFDLAQKNLP